MRYHNGWNKDRWGTTGMGYERWTRHLAKHDDGTMLWLEAGGLVEETYKIKLGQRTDRGKTIADGFASEAEAETMAQVVIDRIDSPADLDHWDYNRLRNELSR